jgi:IS30 family transposase
MLTERRRRWDARHKLARQPALRAIVGDFLAMGWSPEQIAGRLARLQHYPTISHESIYRFVYHRSAQKDYWHRLLPRRKSRRGQLGRRGGGGPTRYIQGRVPVGRRPKVASTRRQAGHWEADLMLFRRYGQAVLVAHERVSRLTHLRRQPSKAAQPVLDNLLALFSPLTRKLRRSVTFDNGSEFSLHAALTDQLGMRTFFCDPHAPWQKGGIENAIGRLRRPLPRKSDLARITQLQLDQLIDRYNSTPRKCLSFRTPLEVFHALSQPVALQP